MNINFLIKINVSIKLYWITIFDVVKSPQKTINLPNSDGWLDKGYFYFSQISIFQQKLVINKIWVNHIF